MVLLCLKIFSARIIDVSISTFRTVLIVRGYKLLSTLLAFFEVFIWFFAARTALLTNISSLLIPISYSLGYATGSYIGMFFTNIFISNYISIKIITSNKNMINVLKRNNYGVTNISVSNKNKYMLYIATSRNKFNKLKCLVMDNDSKAFMAINQNDYIFNGWIK